MQQQIGMINPQVQYGGVQFINGPSVIKSPSPFLHGTRRAMNSHAIGIMLFVPWLLFLTIYLICATAMRYSIYRDLGERIYYVGIAIVVITWLFAINSWRRKCAHDPFRQHSWLLLAAISLTIAFLCGTVFGDMNFYYHTQPAHDVENLNTYGNKTAVDPSVTKGEAIMDAGRIYFTEAAHLDENKAMTFKNRDLYCVAPIVVGNKPLRSYDYWAVGVNCCSSRSGAKFACGEFANPHAKAGLRLMRDDQRAFFRLAVQQAEVSYGIKAEHPLFFEWMQDPSSVITNWREEAYRWHLMCVLGYFIFNGFCVTVAVVFFSKLGRY